MTEKEKCVIDQKFQTKVHLVWQSLNGQYKIKQNKHYSKNWTDAFYKDAVYVSWKGVFQTIPRKTKHVLLPCLLDLGGIIQQKPDLDTAHPKFPRNINKEYSRDVIQAPICTVNTSNSSKVLGFVNSDFKESS